MINGRYQVRILFSPESSSLASVAETMAPMFDPARYDVVARPAATSSVADLFAADIILFGSNDEANFSHGGFAELKEALSDVRLSGRLTAVFSSISTISLRNLTIMLKPTGALVAADELLIRSSWDDPKTHDVLEGWVRAISRAHAGTVGIR